MSDAVSRVLDELSARYGTTVEHLWSVIVRKQAIDGLYDMVLGAVLLLLSVAAFVVALRYARRAEDGDTRIAVLMGAGVFVFLAGLVALSFIRDGAICLSLPEFCALEEVVSMLGRKAR